MHPSAVPLARLVPDDRINVRKTDTGPDPSLVASIKVKGLTTALTVRPHGDVYSITDGRRRYLAVKQLVEAGELDEDYELPILVRDEEDADARDTSLTTAIVRAPLHPVDRYEAFAELQAGGMSSAEIAGHYALDERQVRQVLALGGLAPEIREAWRTGEIDAGKAQAFTLATTSADQVRVYKKLKKSGQLGWGVRTIHEAFIGKQKDIGRLIQFVGVDPLRAAGGRVNEDLFGTNHTVADPKLVKKLADEKLAAECARLVEEGWAWAVVETDLPQGARWSYAKIQPKKPAPTKAEKKRLAEIEEKLEAEKDADAEDALQEEIEAIQSAMESRAFSAEDKAKAGCIVGIDHGGALQVDRGLLKPEQAKREKARERAKEKAEEKKARTAGGESQPEEPRISNALSQRLSEQLSAALTVAVAASPELALAALLAGFACADRHAAPIKVSEQGLAQAKYGRRYYGHEDGGDDEEEGGGEDTLRQPFADSLAQFLEATHERKVQMLAAFAGQAVNTQTFNADHPPLTNAAVAALATAVEPGRMQASLREAFDAADYFGSVSKAVCLKAIREAVNDDEARKVSGKPKADVAAFAIENVPATGWLPPELRTAHYDGPGRGIEAALTGDTPNV